MKLNTTHVTYSTAPSPEHLSLYIAENHKSLYISLDVDPQLYSVPTYARVQPPKAAKNPSKQDFDTLPLLNSSVGRGKWQRKGVWSPDSGLWGYSFHSNLFCHKYKDRMYEI